MEFDKATFGSFSQALQAYAIAQLDPFHDTPYRLEGAPSDACSDSVVLVMNQEKIVSASTFGLSTNVGDKWDLHVALLPMIQDANFYQAAVTSPCFLTGTLSGSESDFTNLFPITAYGVTSGDKTFAHYSGDTTPVGITPNIAGFFSNSSSNVFVPRVIRCIGVAFEVVDETPKMYQQGSVTVYSRPSNRNVKSRNICRFYYGGTNRTQSIDVSEVACPPNDIKQATILPNSKTWKASEGAYVVGRNYSSDNDFKRCSTNDILFYNPVDPDTSSLLNSFMPREILAQTQDPGNTANADSFNVSTPYNISGAYFCGISSQYGTYRIRSKFMFEVLPDPTDTSLIALSTPTIPRDPDFERLLYRTISMLPPGCPQTSNPKGEFWRVVQGVAKRAVKYIKPALGVAAAYQTGDQASMLAATEQIARLVAQDATKKKKKNKDKQKQQQTQPAQQEKSKKKKKKVTFNLPS